MGTYKGSVTADYEYPLVFQKAFINMLQANAPKSPFRYIQLGGKFIRPDQDASLWFLPEPRKLKVRIFLCSYFSPSTVILTNVGPSRNRNTGASPAKFHDMGGFQRPTRCYL